MAPNASLTASTSMMRPTTRSMACCTRPRQARGECRRPERQSVEPDQRSQHGPRREGGSELLGKLAAEGAKQHQGIQVDVGIEQGDSEGHGQHALDPINRGESARAASRPRQALRRNGHRTSRGRARRPRSAAPCRGWPPAGWPRRNTPMPDQHGSHRQQRVAVSRW